MGTIIKGNDSIKDVVIKMSGGNPGAINALFEIINHCPQIDPDNLMGGIGTILLLDTYNIYASNIYVLWSDICERDIVKMIGVLRACQMGLFPSSILKDACNRQDFSGKNMIPLDELLGKVKEALPNFNLEHVTT
jgi:hypothetical protein